MGTQNTGELHFVVPLRIDEAAEHFQRLTDKGILVHLDKVTPQEQKLHLDHWDDELTTVYVRLSTGESGKTRVDLSLSRGITIPPIIYYILGIAGVAMVLEFLFYRTVMLSISGFALVAVYAVRIYYDNSQTASDIDRKLLADNQLRRRANEVIDAVIELFKDKGAKILSE